MCGLAGILDARAATGRDELAAQARAMASAMVHRGPDDGGVWVDAPNGVALSHRRLSILDLSPEGHQPMLSASGRFAIAFNGEIYNFGEIRDELGTRVRWRGHSDTEIMLAAFENFGLEATLARLNGMFAFALWDSSRRELHLCRDRMGEKPLYYAWAGRTFLFGSELKALRTHPAFRPAVSRGALGLYVRHGYVPGPHSIHEGVYKLPPASLMTLSASRPGVSTPRPYWSLAEAIDRNGRVPPGRDDDALDEIEALARDAVKLRMHADVPLGAFLSGGIDSSTVVALMQSQSSRPVRTFTIGFREAGFDEAVHARRVAEHLHTEHTELYITPQGALDVVPLLPALYDEPFADSSQIPTYLVSKLARTRVTVSLSGDAGDELFGGYERYPTTERIWRALRRVPAVARPTLARALRALAPAGSERVWDRTTSLLPSAMRRAPAHKLRRLADMVEARSSRDLYRDLLSAWHDPSEVLPGVRDVSSPLTEDIPVARPLGLLETMMYLDTVSYLPDDILVKVDRASMGVSLESRVPFLDHRFVERAWMLPPALKSRGRLNKWPLRRILYKHVPREIVERPKMGFGVPIAEWLRGPLRSWANDLLAESSLRSGGFFDSKIVRGRLAQHLAGTYDWSSQLWIILMFQAWFAATGA